MRIVLASASPYRRDLLRRLGLAFDVDAAAIDESRLADEPARSLVARLAEAKARAVAVRHPDALVVGSDQVALLGSAILTKPGSARRAVEQLSQMRGRTVHFLTGLCLLDATTGHSDVAVEPFDVTFANVSDAAIEAYVERDQPLDCAGSIRAEGLGIALIERMHGSDPTALVGLPLIRLTQMLRADGIEPLTLRSVAQ